MSNLLYPVDFHRYIAIHSDEKLDPAVYQTWLKCVKQFAPNGVVYRAPNVASDGSPTSVSMVAIRTKTGYEYRVPVTRDLQDKEIRKVEDAFTGRCPDAEVKVVTHVTVGEKEKEKAIDKTEYAGLCTAWAKHQHDSWMQERTDDGWRYGPNLDFSSKTHPLIRPWDELPAKFKKADYNHPKLFMDLLDQQGYSVISKDEYKALRNLFRKVQ